jgi:glyoxylase-like metal-dependent hydrolase (beta-lactamase superfamily II)
MKVRLNCISDLLTNSYILEGEGLVLVDTGWPSRLKPLMRKARRAGYDLRQVKYIVLTHNHLDHACNAAALKKLSGAELLAHSLDVPVIDGSSPPPPGSEICITGKAMRMAPGIVSRVMSYHPVQVEHHLEGGDELDFLPGWEVLHLPGHTRGSMGLLNREKRWALAGDALSHLFGLLWLPTLAFSDSLTDIAVSIEVLRDLDLKALYPGHGPALTGDVKGKLDRFLQQRSRWRDLFPQ